MAARPAVAQTESKGLDGAAEDAVFVSARPRAAVAPYEVMIVVLNWNRRAEILECLESLRQTWFGGAKALVVDNGSRDGSVEAIRERFPEVRVIALPENRGYAGGNNTGIRAALEAGARAVLLLNNDAIVAPDFLGWLLHVLNTVPRVAAVSAAVLRKDCPEILEHAYLDLSFGHGLVHRHGVNALPGEGFDVVRPVEVGIGCCFLVHADALRSVGLLDESYFAYHEDVDWCFRARQQGWEIYYQPLSRVWHHGSGSTHHEPPRRQDMLPGGRANPPWNPVRAYLGARNAVRFVRAHGGLRQKMYFACSSLYALPLELLAAVMDREDDIRMGVFTYRRAFAQYCLPGGGASRQGRRRRLGRALRVLVRIPVRLLWSLPCDIRRAHRQGYTLQAEECARGLWDGVRDRALPLERLGLR